MNNKKDLFEEVAKRSGFPVETVKAVVHDMEYQLKEYVTNPDLCNGDIKVEWGLKLKFRWNKAIADWYRCLLGYNSNDWHIPIYNKFIKPKLHSYHVQTSWPEEANQGFCSEELSGNAGRYEDYSSSGIIDEIDWNREPVLCKRHD